MRALIVDDSRFVRGYLRELLSALNIESEEAEDGLAALAQLEKPSGEMGFEVALVDLNMPRMGGLSLVKSIRATGAMARMKLMMVTTEADMVFVSTALRLGADEFLMKPFSPEGLKEKLQLLGLLEG